MNRSRLDQYSFLTTFRYNGAYFLAEAAISLFEAHSYRRSDNIAVTTYGKFFALPC